MTTVRMRNIILPLSLAGVIALASVSGGTSADAAQKPDEILAKAQKELAKGHVDQAIKLAEAAVAANPRESNYRALLGQAYLRAGRFDSAATALNDAMTLGDNGQKTALALALANAGMGKDREAVAILTDWHDAIPASDLGLALALAGEPERGAAVLADALRNGENTPKIRQNLAYAYALDGRWLQARVMMQQDVPADQVDARISDWALKAKPEDSQLRVASLLGAPMVRDPGQPTALALNSRPDEQQLAAEDAAIKAPASVAAAAPSELPPVEIRPIAAPVQVAQAPAPEPVEIAPAPVPEPVEVAAAPAPVRPEANEVVSNPVVQPIAQAFARVFASTPKARPAPIRVALAAPRPVHHQGTHLVQLGSFASEQGARRAWGIYTGRDAQLRNYQMKIIPVIVNGKNYWRVAAAGFDAGGANGWCSRIKAHGGQCLAYSTSRVFSEQKAFAEAQARAVRQAHAEQARPAKGRKELASSR